MNKYWHTLREISALLLSVGALIFVGFRGALAHGREKIFIWGLVAVGIVALTEYVYARQKLRRSRKALIAVNDDSTTGDMNDTDTWFGEIRSAFVRVQNELHSVDSAQPEALPTSSDLAADARMRAERAAIVLRWLSGAAVLGGLLGTLFGLTESIRLLVEAIKNLGTTVVVISGVAEKSDFDFSKLAAALAPIQFCFWSSFCGVLLSAPLGLLRIEYEALLDEHLTAAQTYFDMRRSDLFKEWRSPSSRMAEAAESLNSLNVTLSNEITRLSSEIAGNLTVVTTDILEAQEKRLATLSQSVPDAIATSMKASSSEVLADLHRRQREFDKEYRLDRDAVHEHAEQAGSLMKQNVQTLTTLSADAAKGLQQVIASSVTTSKEIASLIATGESTRVRAMSELVETVNGLLGEHKSTLICLTEMTRGTLQTARDEITHSGAHLRQNILEGASALDTAATKIDSASAGLATVATSANEAARTVADCATQALNQAKLTADAIGQLDQVRTAIVGTLMPQLEELTEATSTQTFNLGEMRASVDSLRSTLLDASQVAAGVEVSVVAATKGIADLKDVQNASQSATEVAAARIDEASNGVAAATAKATQLVADTTVVAKRIADLQGSVNDLKSSVDNATTSLEVHASDTAKLRENTTQLRKSIEGLNASSEILNEALKPVTEATNTLRTAIRGSTDQTKELVNHIDDASKEIAREHKLAAIGSKSIEEALGVFRVNADKVSEANITFEQIRIGLNSVCEVMAELANIHVKDNAALDIALERIANQLQQRGRA